MWHSNDKYRRVVWQCNHKFDGGEKCSTPHLDEETIKGLFIKAVNILTTEKDEMSQISRPSKYSYSARGNWKRSSHSFRKN